MSDTFPQRPYSRPEAAGAQPSGQGGAQSKETSAAPPPTGWPTPIPLNEVPDPLHFPVEHLPAWLRRWIIAEAEATQTPPDLAAMLALACCGAGIARNFRVEIRHGWEEPTNIYAAVALPSGERKSAVFADAIGPIEEYEAEQQARMASIIAQAASQHRTLVRRLKAAEARTAKETDPIERQRLTNEARAGAEELAAHFVPELPIFVCDDETPENLARILALNGGRMFVASPEGTILAIANGNNSESANFDVLLKGHAGDTLRAGRITRGRDHVIRPALTLALAFQTEVLRGLARHEAARLRGLWGRFALAVPNSKIGGRIVGAPAVPADVASGYRNNLLALWQLPAPKSDEPGYACHWLRFSPAADNVLRDLEVWIEPQLDDRFVNSLPVACPTNKDVTE